MDVYKNKIGIVNGIRDNILYSNNTIHIIRLTLVNNQNSATIINLSKQTNALEVLITAKDTVIDAYEALIETNIILNTSQLILTTDGLVHYDINYIEII